jgi:hypothetical protein
MKKLIVTFSLLSLLIMVSSALSAQSKKEDKKAQRVIQYNEIVKLIEYQKFQFEATKAFPQGMQPIDLTTNPNYTRIKDSLAIAYMPFFGRAYSAAYGQDGGIEYEVPMTDVKITKNDKKMRVLFEYVAKGKNDTYRVSIDVSYGGNATMFISCNNRSAISYDGDVAVLKEEEKKE